ncbi:MAG: bifunctional ADP-heptose synthase, partial [Acetobacteraceae bacterium]
MDAVAGQSGDTELAQVVRHFSDARVLVLGDVMLDRYVSGSASRLSPEAPIPVLRPTARRATVGGAANVALNVATLGGQVALVGVIGNDAEGAELAQLLESSGIVPHLVTATGRPTTAKTRFMVGTHQLLRLDEETAASIDDTTADRVVQRFSDALRTANVVVLSDYAKGVLSDPVLRSVLAQCRSSGCMVIADPKRMDFSSYRGATVLTPNEYEVRRATRIEADDDSEADRAGRRALDDTGCAAVLVTRSAKGLTLVRRDEPPLHLPTRAREVADVSGAGDTLVAALAVALGAGAALPEAAMLANITA